MKQIWNKQKAIMVPQPVAMISTYDADGNVDVMNAAWIGVLEEDMLIMSLSSHQTTDNLKLNGALTISPATKKTAVESDFFGMVSAKRDPQKFARSGFHAHPSDVVKAPVIDEYPLTFECEVASLGEEDGGFHLIAKIVRILVDDSILTNGNIDYEKMEPICLDAANHEYRVIGAPVCQAFHAGLALKK